MRIRKFNESESYDLSFDGFKEVMSDITDEFNLDYDFEDNSNSTNKYDDRFYELKIYLPESSYIETTNILSYDLGGLASPEDGGDTLSDIRVTSCIASIDDNNSKLREVKHSIDTQIENNNLVKRLLSEILKIKGRLSSFDNFGESRLGQSITVGSHTEITITFEIK